MHCRTPAQNVTALPNQPNLRHNIILLVDASCQGTYNFLRCQREPQRAECTHSPLNLSHGGVFTNCCQKDVTSFVGHRDLRSEQNSH